MKLQNKLKKITPHVSNIDLMKTKLFYHNMVQKPIEPLQNGSILRTGELYGKYTKHKLNQEKYL